MQTIDRVEQTEGGELALRRELELPPEVWRLITPEVYQRWADDLAESDLTADTLIEIAQFERNRQKALKTLRAQADLTELESRFVRYLMRNERRTMTYLAIARHLWSTPNRPITAATLRVDHGYGSRVVAQIQGLAHGARRKLEIDPRRPQHLASIIGVGYRWYSDVPALDDGENYARRDEESAILRRQMQQELGIVEVEGVILSLPEGWTIGQPLSGPELPQRSR